MFSDASFNHPISLKTQDEKSGEININYPAASGGVLAPLRNKKATLCRVAFFILLFFVEN